MADIQIHELNTFSGTPGATDFIPIDNGSETFKVSAMSFHHTSIPNNADLNDYTTVGFYGCSTAAIAQSLKNCPVKTNFGMIVLNKSMMYSTQIIFSSFNSYIREQTSAGWYNWYAYSPSDRVETLTPTLQVAQYMRIYKVGQVVTIILTNINNLPTASAANVFATLPQGWRPPVNLAQLITDPNRTKIFRLNVSNAGVANVYNYTDTAVSGNTNASGVISYVATQ